MGDREQRAGAGVVLRWEDDEGWGVIALDDGGLQLWTHYSAVEAPPGTYRSLRAGQRVRCRYEVPGQDGYPGRAVSVAPAG
ncbi:cold shock domain-containing protein [Dactylosporangium salmoneum]|uniref:CSD domain-containing protein n=1 Tax=Dactylosporangium salmoneum TaxID=53361 RepID=A0ABN3I2Z3_9ACTN